MRRYHLVPPESAIQVIGQLESSGDVMCELNTKRLEGILTLIDRLQYAAALKGHPVVWLTENGGR